MSFKSIIFQRDPEVAEPVAERDWGYRESSDDDIIVEDDDPIAEETAVVEETPVVPITTEVVAPIVEAVVPEPVVPEQVAPVDWKQAIKAADKYDALKELGYDDFTINMLKYKEQAGDFTPYLQVKTVDYNAMAAEQLMRMDLQKQNPGMSERALDFKFKKEFTEKYYTDREDYPEDSDEAIYGQEQLRLDSENKRKQFIEEQAKFKAPEPQADLGASRKAEEQIALQEQRKSFVMESPVTKSFLAAKSFSFGEGEASFSYPIADVQQVINDALSAVLVADEMDMKPETLQRFYKSLAIARDPDAFYNAVFKNGQNKGVKKVGDEIGNVTPINTPTIPVEENLTPAQQLARYGKSN